MTEYTITVTTTDEDEQLLRAGIEAIAVEDHEEIRRLVKLGGSGFVVALAVRGYEQYVEETGLAVIDDGTTAQDFAGYIAHILLGDR